jgi:hypothetical protein
MNLLILLLFIFNLVWSSSVDRPMSNTGSSIQYTTESLYPRRGELLPPEDIFDLKDLNQALFTEFKRENEDLKRIKFYLVNGENRLASVYLSNLAQTKSKLRPVIYRYLAIINFIDGNFSRSYDYLKDKQLNSTPHYSKVCTLRVLNQIILNITKDLDFQWDRCKKENFISYLKIDPLWIDTLIEFKLKPRSTIDRASFGNKKLESFENEDLKLFLKLAIYLNQEQEIEPSLATLGVNHLRDPEIRELAGHIYFRTSSFVNSHKFIEDLNSPNAENIKGNLYLLRNEFKPAYEQFKLALEQKKNSQNAMERLLPLAWLLADWEGGSSYVEKVVTSPQTLIGQMTLASAFLVQKGSYQEAKTLLDSITQRSRKGNSIEVAQLYSFSSLMQNQSDQAKKHAAVGCAQYDLINCWMLFQLSQWDSFPLLVQREDKITHRSEWENLTKVEINDPLKENVYVNQLDIEELDDKLIQLIPKSNDK